jgi:hypothetical protein
VYGVHFPTVEPEAEEVVAADVDDSATTAESSTAVASPLRGAVTFDRERSTDLIVCIECI